MGIYKGKRKSDDKNKQLLKGYIKSISRILNQQSFNINTFPKSNCLYKPVTITSNHLVA